MASRIKIPGVFIQEIPNPALISPSLGILTAAVVGTALSTYVVRNAEVVRTAGSDDIPDVEAADVASVTSIGDYIDVPKYVQGVDFSVAGKTITWLGATQPTLGATYFVTYNKNKSAAYYEPLLFTDIDSVRQNFGYELDNGSMCQITAAAKLMFDNGAARVMVVQAASGGNSDVQAALDKLQKEDVQVILMPGITNSTLQTYLKSHVDNQSSISLKKERVAFIAPVGLTDSTTTIGAQSTSMADERIFNLAPGAVNVTFKDHTLNEDTQVLVSSIYAGAALAGRLVNPNIRLATPLTRKTPVNIDNLNGIKYLNTEIETLAGAGTMVLYTDPAGVVKVNQGLTTDVSNANTSEISVVMIKDELRRLLRNSLDAEYIGGELDTITGPTSVKASVTQLLKSQKGILLSNDDAAIKTVSTKLNDIDPTAVDVFIEVSVIRPFNYINISFTVSA